MKIDVKAIECHRNGVSGQGFWTVRFACPEVEREFTPRLAGDFLAIMPTTALEESPGKGYAKGYDGECYVVFLPSPEMNWRGDHFSDDVRDAINTHEYRKPPVVR